MALTRSRPRMTAGSPANIVDFGAVGDGVADDRAAIQAAIDSGLGEVVVPYGTYLVSAPLDLEPGVSLRMEEGAVIKASAAMEAIIRTPLAEWYDNGLISGGTLHCNALADCGIWLKMASYTRITHIQIRENKVDAIRLGAAAAALSSYEMFLHDIRIIRSLTTAPVGSNGIRIEKCGDSHFTDVVIMGQETGVSGSLSDSKLTRCHCWNALENGKLEIGFALIGYDTILSQCQVDGPLLSSGYYLNGLGNTLIGCCVNQTPPSYGGVDAEAVGVYVETGASCVVANCNFKSQSASSRLAADVSGDLSNARLINNTSVNVIDVVSDRSKTLARAWVTFNGTGTPAIRASFGVASIADLGLGDYQINFTRTMGNTDFNVQATGRTDGGADNGILVYEYFRSATAVSVRCLDPVTENLADPTYVNVMVMGT